MKQKKQKGGFLSMLLGTLGVSLLENLLAGKGAIETSQGRETNMPGRTDFEIKNYYQNELKFNSV